MELIHGFIDLIVHLDRHLLELVSSYGGWVYAILFVIVFCETGLVVTPFLPGDSLLFVAGTIAGAWFLREFVDGFPWVHLDIAGTAYLDSEGASHAKGPTAVGVRLFTEFLLKRAGA